MKAKEIGIVAISSLMLYSCAIVRPGEVGLRQKLGKLSDKTHTQGAVWFNPFTTKVIKTSIRINDIELSISLPSKEGLSVVAQISILYRIDEKYSIAGRFSEFYRAKASSRTRCDAYGVCS